MERTAKIFLTNRSQAVRLPKEFQFDTGEVFIHREGEKVVLSPRPSNWNDYLNNGAVAPADFMADVEDLPVQDRDL
ncbi:MAG: type II toxin-antitoxin system VapB family antitoxin [Candidatus Obscuribacterales bacterium]|nr:type II toxin-antitoxin system VapB family antitoxin [Candidatus Obscuribacterales bacterium]